MGWKGMALGGWIGSLFGGPLGAILGAALGHTVEKHISGPDKGAGKRWSGDGATDSHRAMVFCASAAAMLAKMAKADGVVTREEIESVENAFARLGFSSGVRSYAVKVFRKAKDDGHSIYEYAAEFAAAVPSVEVRELLYGLLWDTACADGRVTPAEDAILRNIPRSLGINPVWYSLYARDRYARSSGSGRGGSSEPPRDSLADAYSLLGASASDSDDVLRRKYRELAKRHHPDALRAQGMPEELVGKANEKMGRINAAWAEIRSARGL